MSTTSQLSDLQTLASTMEANLDWLALRLRSQDAHHHAVRAVGMLSAAVREIGAAAAHEQLRAAAAPSNDAPLVEVISPGADRADELIRTINPYVMSISIDAAAVRLGLPDDAAGLRTAGEIMQRNGWRQNAFGFWHRPGHGAAAGVTPGQPR